MLSNELKFNLITYHDNFHCQIINLCATRGSSEQKINAARYKFMLHVFFFLFGASLCHHRKEAKRFFFPVQAFSFVASRAKSRMDRKATLMWENPKMKFPSTHNLYTHEALL
jgi:hypothetical protein